MVFRPYPQVIQRFFNTNWFGPPPRVTGGSACPRIDHPASGPPRRTGRAIRTRFRFGSAISGLTSRARGDSQAHYAKGMRSPHRGSRSPGAHDFRVCFTPLEGVLFTFPSRYSFAIGRQPVFSLVGWAPRIRTGFHVSRPTWDAAGELGASRMGLSPAAARLSRRSRSRLAPRHAVPLPRRMNPPVWARPLSLAATCGISVDFLSSGY